MGHSQTRTETAAEPKTFFAPPERATPDDLARWSAAATNHPVMDSVLKTLGGVVALLNPERQIVALNTELLRTLGAIDTEAVLGLRPGEALGCVHAATAPSGCGTGRACASCGAAVAIVSAMTGEECERECLLTLRRGEEEDAAEFLARARRVEIDGLPYTMVLLHDIQDRKRREALERTFFHDLLNTVGSLRSYGELLPSASDGDRDEMLQEMEALMARVVSEVESHRDLFLAERGEYPVHPVLLYAQEVLDALRTAFVHHHVRLGKTLVIEPSAEQVETDRTLLLRVLTNMVKNAFEAIAPGQTVRVGCSHSRDAVTFHVHNPGQIADHVAIRVFQRSFSTKGGAGRGIGTYSMKLFGQRCLGGDVRFDTSQKDGTTFTLRLPRRFRGTEQTARS